MKIFFKIIMIISFFIPSTFSFANEYPEAFLGKEEGFIDILLSISKYEKLENGSKKFTVQNLLNGKKISFVIELLPKWTTKKIDKMNVNMYWGEAKIISTGSESDIFLSQLTNLYGIKTESKKFTSNTLAQVVGLANDPSNIEYTPIKMKFFFNSNGNHNLYSEVYINIDLNKKTLEFNEKDPEYRLALVQSISQ